ncbi:MAG: Ig-like domain-containing protein [Saprospiraceae bacterium]|nr:Ig-like domain-containing protein [Saprospiraceae bacterium]
MKEKLRSSSPTTVDVARFDAFWAPENCTNGIDDDGDGFVDSADPDCGCSQTIMLAARDNGQILRINLSTGGTVSVATSSPYVSGNLNAMGANADNNLVYYCAGKQVYYWDPATNQHGIVVDLTGKIGTPESLSSGGGEYYDGYLYLGTENGAPGVNPKIWRQQLSADGKSFIGNPVNLNANIPNHTSWGDMIATSEGGQVVIYGMTAASTSFFWKFNVATNVFTTIRNDLPTEMQLGVDIDGNTWAGSLSSGMIQKINRNTGFFFGSVLSFGGNIWDLTGPINCPQAVEICGNGIDDDGDGLTDNQDQECLCPAITPNDPTTRTICEGQTLNFNVTDNAPNPPYTYIEFYRFATPQANPYLSTDPKVWLGEFPNTAAAGSISSANFPNTGSTDLTYYVYACVKPAPQFPATCAPTASYTVVVRPAANVNAGADVTICAGTSASLNAIASGAPAPLTYAWSNGLGTGATKSVSPASTTTYTVTVTAGNSCTSTDAVTVNVNPSPAASAGANASICSGTSRQLTASATGGTLPYTFSWSHGLGTSPTVTITPTSTQTYTVTVAGANGCASTSQVTITTSLCQENCTNGIDDDGDGLVDCADNTCPITLDGEDYFSICTGAAAQLSVSAVGGSGIYTYTWSHGLGTGTSKVVYPLATTDYVVTVTPTSGCTATRLFHVVVVPCPEDCVNGIDDDFDGLIDCADPDCAMVGAPLLVDDLFTTCPTLGLTDRVTYNDGNIQNPAFSIISLPAHGSVTIDGTGKFTYTPIGQYCGNDVFTYQVCNTVTGCCDQAQVTIVVGDVAAPTMLNVPADLTIGCDDAVPMPSQVFAFDACPGIYMDFEENYDLTNANGCQTYFITRTWTATDLCGNETVGTQLITVQDLAGPEIQRLYTLANGKKLVSGIAQFTTNNWKYVPFPNTFATVPVVFAQATSENEGDAVTPQLRNVTTQGFEVKLKEQETSTGEHAAEKLSWMAMEAGQVSTVEFGLEAGLVPAVSSTVVPFNFNLAFSTVPALVATTQTVNQEDPSNPRFQNVSSTGAEVFLDEESSKDAETTHPAEAMAYLAVTADADIVDQDGDFVGESGVVSLTNSWVNVNLRNRYNKPVVIMGGVSMNDGDPATVRVRNVNATGFQVRLQEWPYQNGTHGVEQVSYFVVEGSMPPDIGYYCGGRGSNLKANVNIFANDNCDDQATLGYTETEETLGTGIQTTRTWVAVDDCGRTTLTSRFDTCTIAAVRLKAVLNGAFIFNGGTGLMRDDLRSQGRLPFTEPFSNLSGFTHKGKGGGEVVLPSMFEVTGNNAIVDWVFVEIRDEQLPTLVLATKSALVQRDGDVVGINGSDVLMFPTLGEGNYFVTLRHRNHVGIMVDAPEFLTSLNPPLVDFMNVDFGVKGWNEAGKIVTGKRTLWAGDLNGDLKAIYQGPGNDVFTLFTRVLGDPINENNLANFIVLGYDRNDLNMDGRVIYQGPGNERATLLTNTILSHPGNPGFLANYIVKSYLP